MNYNAYLQEKLSKLIFLNIKKEALETIFKSIKFKQEFYIPINSSKLVEKIDAQNNLDNIEVSMIIEGMFYVLGADENFKYNHIYKKIVNSDDTYIKSIKKSIYEAIKRGSIEDACVFLKGLVTVENTKENNEKLLIVLEELRKQNDIFTEAEIAQIEEIKKEFANCPVPYLYEAILKKDKLDYEGSFMAFNQYISLDGATSSDIESMMKDVKVYRDYNKAKEILKDSPIESLKLLLPIVDEYPNKSQIYYDIALGYRLTENYEKAIYYLNEILQEDNTVIEAISELGLNYACLGNYENAITFFRKAFEVTKAIELCTNLIMCYINIGDIKQAEMHLDIAKKINPKDEILNDIEKMLKENRKK